MDTYQKVVIAVGLGALLAGFVIGFLTGRAWYK